VRIKRAFEWRTFAFDRSLWNALVDAEQENRCISNFPVAACARKSLEFGYALPCAFTFDNGAEKMAGAIAMSINAFNRRLSLFSCLQFRQHSI
jgi:hypothetical protein